MQFTNCDLINFSGIGHAVNEPFFTLEIADAQLDLGGITIVSKLFVLFTSK